MKRIKIKELLNTIQGEKSVLVKGWVRTRRDSKGGFSFLEINDGSCQANIQVIVEHSLKEFSELEKKIYCQSKLSQITYIISLTCVSVKLPSTL